MPEINDIIYLILAFSIFTLLVVIITSATIRSRQNKNAKALKDLTSSIAEIKAVVTSISDKQHFNEIVIGELKETLEKHVHAEEDSAVVVEIAEEPVVEEIEEKVVEPSTPRTVELAAKIAEYATQIEQLNEITDPQIRDLKKQLLIFELQEIKREIALIEG